jgi:hypothetical protein
MASDSHASAVAASWVFQPFSSRGDWWWLALWCGFAGGVSGFVGGGDLSLSVPPRQGRPVISRARPLGHRDELAIDDRVGLIAEADDQVRFKCGGEAL